MPRHRVEHRPSRPTWRCAACGIAWPCSPAKLRLLAQYREDRVALMAHLARLRAEAAADLAGVNAREAPAALDERFTAWARPR